MVIKAVQITKYEGPNGDLYSTSEDAVRAYKVAVIEDLLDASSIYWREDVNTTEVARYLIENWDEIKAMMEEKTIVDGT